MTRSSPLFKTAPARFAQAGFLVCAMAMLAAPQALAAGDEPGFLTGALGLRTSVPEAPDFVVQTRRPVQDFIPVHTPRAKPDGKPMPKDEVAEKEKALDSARLKQDKLVGRVSAPVGKSVAESMDVKDPKKKSRKAACGLTCSNPALLPSQSGKEAQ